MDEAKVATFVSLKMGVVLLFLASMTSLGTSADAEGRTSQEFQVIPWCHVEHGMLFVHTIVKAETSLIEAGKAAGEKLHRRTLWNLECRLVDGSCRGVRLDLDGLDKGLPLMNNKVIPLSSETGALPLVKISSKTKNAFVVSVWPGRTLSIDLQSKNVRYVESWEGVESRGEGPCS